jgi:uncharacterized protein (TIGR03083 family)
MPTIVDRDTMVALLEEEFAAVITLGRSLSDTDWDTATCLPGWSVRDNLSHMIGTESMLLQLAAPEAGIGDLPHVKNPIGEANEVWVESMRSLSGAEVVDRFEEVSTRRNAALSAMTQADFDAPSWTPAGPDETYGRFMRIRHFDCFMHEHDMRTAVGAPDRPDVAHLASALDEVTTGVGFIVGKRAKAPQGSRVRIELSGPVERVLLVAVDERAAIVAELDGPPTVVVEMPAMLFLRLTGGREPGAPHIGSDVTLQGDLELGQRLTEHLAFTI